MTRASMEPCLFRHGKCQGPARGVVEVDLLQWSHVFSDMVSGRAPGRHSGNIAGLQWSHVFSDMVRSEVILGATVPLGLQWSHVFSDMVRRNLVLM